MVRDTRLTGEQNDRKESLEDEAHVLLQVPHHTSDTKEDVPGCASSPSQQVDKMDLGQRLEITWLAKHRVQIRGFVDSMDQIIAIA